ncbi:hypothetical protein COCNU_09G001670 [Cocos nucifera]|uniref:Uncharacterized protein n=1 Tax=Cocos nucifera TaxID=13894 RepID=A0A8K0IJU5_COCNU|nr:hypothetical protein COCNU_09G001670 [Cocos nucifera]
MVPPVSLSSSATDSLKSIIEFLKSYLTPTDRWALDGEGTQHQMASAFRSLALVSHYLASFADASSEFSPLELVETSKSDTDRLVPWVAERVPSPPKVSASKALQKRRIDSTEVEVALLKKAKDQLSKVVGEASNRAEDAEKKLQDVKMTLMKSTEENARLFGNNKILEAETEKLKARVVKAKASEAEALLAMRSAEEKALRAITDFCMSKEFRKEKASFALDAYDEGKCVVHEEVGSKYPELDLSFLDEIPKASTFDSKDTF